jgi:hypothetical protein
MSAPRGDAGGRVERSREPDQGDGGDEQPEVAQGDVVEAGDEQQVDDDRGQPRGDEVAAEAGAQATTSPATISMTPTAYMA